MTNLTQTTTLRDRLAFIHGLLEAHVGQDRARDLMGPCWRGCFLSEEACVALLRNDGSVYSLESYRPSNDPLELAHGQAIAAIVAIGLRAR